MSSLDGTRKNVTMSIHGKDDMPIISDDLKGTATNHLEHKFYTTNGKLNIIDSDKDEACFKPNLYEGLYGKLSLKSSGDYAYTTTQQAQPSKTGPYGR